MESESNASFIFSRGVMTRLSASVTRFCKRSRIRSFDKTAILCRHGLVREKPVVLKSFHCPLFESSKPGGSDGDRIRVLIPSVQNERVQRLQRELVGGIQNRDRLRVRSQRIVKDCGWHDAAVQMVFDDGVIGLEVDDPGINRL